MRLNLRLSFLAVMCCVCVDAHAAILKKIQYNGNRRIENETIASYLSTRVGHEFDQTSVDLAVKELFLTGYFEDVQVSKSGNTMIIKVVENPIINEVAFEGNNKFKDEQIKQEVPLRPREVLSRTKIQAAQQRILEIYRRMGRFGAKVDPKVIKRTDNRVDLVFEIHEGDVTNVQKIVFHGNESFSGSRLEEELLTKRSRWYRFFASDDVYDPDRFVADQQNLRKFYGDHGYPDFRIENATAELTPNKAAFYLTFTVEEGQKYTYGDIDIESDFKDISSDDLKSSLKIKSGDVYSGKLIERSVNTMTNVLGAKGYAFVSIEPQIIKNRDTQKADIKFFVKEGPRVYIERVEITGNDRTRDHVIRRELELHEGDPYNSFKIKRSEQRVKDLGFFKNASVETEQGSAPDRAKLIVTVEEQSTGEMKLAGGFSTMDGPGISFGITERNFRGMGQTLRVDMNLAKKRQDYVLGFTQPYFLGRDLQLTTDLFKTTTSRISSYSQTSKGGSIGIGYRVAQHLIQTVTYTIHADKVSSILPSASYYLRRQKDKNLTSMISQTLMYDRRDSRLRPTEGYFVSLQAGYAGLGGDVNYASYDLGGGVYYSPNDDVVTGFKMNVGGVSKLGNKQFLVSNSIFMGGDSFRGFEYGGLGPRDGRTGDGLGGMRFWKGTLETQFPLGLPKEFGMRGAVFTDFGCVWNPAVKEESILVPPTPPSIGPDQLVLQKINQSNKIRASIGFGVLWDSPFGPIRVDYAVPVQKESYDVSQRINIGFSTAF